MSPTASDTKKTSDDLRDVFGKYEGHRGDLIPVLQDIQAELGYISTESMQQAARFLNIPRSVVYGVVTFYAQFYLTPQGRNKIKVCLGTACHVRGGNKVLDVVTRRLNINPGETTPDYEVTLERVACVGSCALAPVVVVNNQVHGAVTPAVMSGILDTIDGCRGGCAEKKNNPNGDDKS